MIRAFAILLILCAWDIRAATRGSTPKWRATESIPGEGFTYDTIYPTIVSEETRENIQSPGRKALVIGRGNLQGVDESRIPLEQLKHLRWFFLDPMPHHQDPSQANCLQIRMPITDPTIEKLLAEAFDVVFVDQGVLQYLRLREHGKAVYSQDVELLKEPDPTKHQAIKDKHAPTIKLAALREKGSELNIVSDLFKFVKPGGSLMIPRDGANRSPISAYAAFIKADVRPLVLWTKTIERKKTAESLCESPFLPDNLDAGEYTKQIDPTPSQTFLFEFIKKQPLA